MKMNKIKIIVVLFSLLFSNSFFAQSGWFWQNPHPVGSHLEDCFFIDDNTGYVVGWDGTIIKTTNSGVNWIQQNSGGNRYLASIYFTNFNTGYIVSSGETSQPNNVLLKTTNAGYNWIQIYTFYNAHITDVFFVNDNLGFISGGGYSWGGYIFKTTNAGLNWNAYPQLNCWFLNSIFFTSIDTGYIAGNNEVLKTTNSGINWSFLNVTTFDPDYNSVYFINALTGFVAGDGGLLYKTTNAGLNWTQRITGVTEDLWDIKFKNELTGFITVGGTFVEETGKILKTTNSGDNWIIMPASNIQNYRGISVIGDNIISVGYWGTVVKSTNSGFNWRDLSNSMAKTDLYDVYAIDSLKCFTVGDSSKILRTTDGGINWEATYLGNNHKFNSITFVDANTGYIAGGTHYPNPFPYYEPIIFKTTNGGINWNLNYEDNVNRELKDIKFQNILTGYAVGANSTFLKTTNAGINWSTQNLGTGTLNSIYISNSGNIYVTTGNGNVLKSSNLGNNWSQFNVGTSNPLSSIDFISENTGFVSSYNKIYKTTNGGQNWSSGISNNIPYTHDIRCIKFINDNIGFAIAISFPEFGRAGDIIKTTNNGLNWERISTFSIYPSYQRRGLNSIDYFGNTVFIVGEKHTILKSTNNSGTINIQQLSQQTPKSYFLTQNYPNPFNPLTKIKFDVPSNVKGQMSNVKLFIYDLLGRDVATLVNEELKPGTYEADWDGSNYSSGVYFYKLVVGDPSTTAEAVNSSGRGFVETKKMVLMK